MGTAKNAGKRWTGDEEIRLITLFSAGNWIDEIATALGRTESAILQRLQLNKYIDYDGSEWILGSESRRLMHKVDRSTFNGSMVEATIRRANARRKGEEVESTPSAIVDGERKYTLSSTDKALVDAANTVICKIETEAVTLNGNAYHLPVFLKHREPDPGVPQFKIATDPHWGLVVKPPDQVPMPIITAEQKAALDRTVKEMKRLAEWNAPAGFNKGKTKQQEEDEERLYEAAIDDIVLTLGNESSVYKAAVNKLADAQRMYHAYGRLPDPCDLLQEAVTGYFGKNWRWELWERTVQIRKEWLPEICERLFEEYFQELVLSDNYIDSTKPRKSRKVEVEDDPWKRWCEGSIDEQITDWEEEVGQLLGELDEMERELKQTTGGTVKEQLSKAKVLETGRANMARHAQIVNEVQTAMIEKGKAYCAEMVEALAKGKQPPKAPVLRFVKDRTAEYAAAIKLIDHIAGEVVTPCTETELLLAEVDTTTPVSDRIITWDWKPVQA